MKDLKPCPFCGGGPVSRVEVTYTAGLRDSTIVFSVRCKNCGVMKSTCLRTPEGDSFQHVENAIAYAVNCWNERAYETEDTI